MANRYSVEFDVNTTGYTEGVNSAKEANASFVSSVQVTDKELKANVRSVAQARKEAIGLAIEYANLSKEQKKAAEGQALLRQLQEAKARAAQLKDVLQDTNNEITAMSSDTASWDAVKEGIGTTADVMTALEAVTGDLVDENGLLGQSIAAIAKIQTVTNAVISVGNTLQKNSALMSRIRTAQEALLTKAITAETAATGKATIAQKAFNVVAKANPYVLLASAILALGAAFVAYTKFIGKSKEEQKAEADEAEKTKAKHEALHDSLEKNILSYENLRVEYNNLKTTAEKMAFIKQHANDFHTLGVEINNTAEAENFFNTNTQAVREAFIKRAMAAAAAAEAALVYKQTMDEINNLESNGKRVTYKQAVELGIDDSKLQNKKLSGLSYTWEIPEEEMAKLRERKAKEAQEKIAKIYDRQVQLEKEGAKKFEEVGVKAWTDASKNVDKAKGGTNTSKQVTFTKDSLSALEKEFSDFQKKYQDGLLPKVSKAEYEKRVKEYKEAISDMKIAMGLELPKTELQKMKDHLAELEQMLSFTVDGSVEETDLREKIREQMKKIQHEENRLKVEISPELTDEDRQRFTEEIDELTNKAIHGDVKIDWDFSGLDEMGQKDAQRLQERYERIGETIENFRDRLKTMKQNQDADPLQIQQLEDKIKELELVGTDTFTRLMELMNQSSEKNEMLKNIEDNISALDSYQQMLSAASGALDVLGDSQAKQAAQFALNSAGMIANMIKEIAALQADAIASGTATGAKLPFPANLAAIATVVSTILGIFSSLPKFADGGIIGGPYTTGDRLLVRANAGERILTRNDQNNIDKALEGRYGTGAQDNIVIGELRLRGNDLVASVRRTLKIEQAKGKYTSLNL